MANAQNNLKYVWGSTGGVTDPDAAQQDGVNYSQGWQAEIPTFEEFNFVLNAVDGNLLALAQKGNWEYEAGITYDAGATVQSSGITWTCVVDGTVGVTPGTDAAKWILGFAYGMAHSTHVNQQGLIISDIGGYSSTTLWEGSDLTIKSALPIISLESTGVGANWLLGNIEGEVCVVDKGSVTVANAGSIAKSQATTYRLFHEGHTPTQAEVSGTIPDAPSNSTGYVRKGGNWVAESTGFADAPADGEQYARRDNAWEVVPDGAEVGDMLVSDKSVAAMAGRRYTPCDGTDVSRTVTFDGLFAEIGVKHGDGNGSSTFTKPNIAPVLKGSFGLLGTPTANPLTNEPATAVDMVRKRTAGDLFWAEAATTNSIWRTIGGVSTWVEQGDFESNVTTSTITSMTYDEYNSALYVVTTEGGNVSHIRKSTDNGVTFTTHIIETAFIRSIAVDNRNGNLWYHRYSGSGVTKDTAHVQYGGVGSVTQAGDFLGGVSRDMIVDEVTSTVWGADDNTIQFLSGGVFTGPTQAWVVAGTYPGTSAVHIALDEDKQILYVADHGTSRSIYALDIATMLWTTYYTIGSSEQFTGLDFDQATGELYLAKQVSGASSLWKAVPAAGVSDTQWYIKY